MKSNKNVTFKGVKVRITARFREHMDPGHGVRKGEIKGAHTASAFKNTIRQAGGEYRRIGTHPADARIKQYEYRLPRGDTGTMRPWRPAYNPSKTTYEMPHGEFMRYLRQALKNTMVRQSGKISTAGPWQGVTKNGLQMEGRIRQTGAHKFELTTAYFVW